MKLVAASSMLAALQQHVHLCYSTKAELPPEVVYPEGCVSLKDESTD